MWEYPAWLRIGVIASFAWLGGVVIYSSISRNFEWVLPYSNRLGPAAITAIAGMAVIAVVCLGIPWIVQAIRR